MSQIDEEAANKASHAITDHRERMGFVATNPSIHFPYGSILALGFACVLFLLSYIPPETTAGLLRFGRGTIANQIGDWLAIPWFSDLLLVWAKRMFIVSILFGVVESLHEHFARKIQPKADDLPPASGKRIPALLPIIGLGILIPALLFSRNAVHGFFWMDDLSILSAATSPSFNWIDYLSGSSASNTWPLFLASFHLSYSVFAFSPIPFNLLVIAALALLWVLGFVYLRNSGISLWGIGFSILLFFFWASWHEVLVGYYALSVYNFALVLAMAVLLSIPQKRSENLRWIGVSFLFAIMLSLTHTIGIATLALLSASVFLLRRVKIPEESCVQSILFACVPLWSAMLVGFVFHVLILGDLSSVIYSSGHTHSSLSILAGRGALFPSRLTGFLGSYVFSSFLIPGNYALANFGSSIPKIAAFGLFFVFAAGIVFAFVRVPSPTRWKASAFLVLFLGTSALPVLGRDQGFSSGHVIYHYYAIMPFFWFIPMVVILWDGLRIRHGQCRHFWIITFLLMGGYLFCQEFSTDISAHGTRLIRTGRKRAAQVGAERRERLTTTSAPIREALSRIPIEIVPLPDIPVSYFHTGDHESNILYQGYRLREFAYLLRPEGKHLQFHPTPEIGSKHSFAAPSPLADVIPRVVLDHIYMDEALQRVFLPSGLQIEGRPMAQEDMGAKDGDGMIPFTLQPLPPQGTGESDASFHLGATPSKAIAPSVHSILFIQGRRVGERLQKPEAREVAVSLRFSGVPRSAHTPLRILLPIEMESGWWEVDLTGWLDFQFQESILGLEFEVSPASDDTFEITEVLMGK